MSTDQHGRRTCDGCSRLMLKAHRIYKGSEYCGSCYKTRFVSADCPACGEAARYHRDQVPFPPCRACERLSRTCYRCGLPAPDARHVDVVVRLPELDDVITKRVPVHAQCVRYFKEDASCGICRRLSRDLQGASHLPEGIKACPSCVTAPTHATCSRCRKYRKVKTYREDGRPLCGACGGESPAEHVCPGCGGVVEGSGASRCERCVIRSRMEREVDLQASVLERDWVASLYRDFAQWSFRNAVPSPMLPARMIAAVGLFRTIDLDETVSQPLTADDLLRLFDSRTLRANLNAIRYLCERYGVQIEKKARSNAKDVALIQKRLSSSAEAPWGRHLVCYNQWLGGKPPRTIAQYLGVAQSFCEMIQLDTGFTQEALVRFLEKTPGARATISVWVSFVRDHYGWKVTMPPKRPAKPRLRRDAVELSQLIPVLREPGSSKDEELNTVIALLFQFDPVSLHRQIDGVDPEGDLLTRDGRVDVPDEAKAAVAEWARRNLADPARR